MGVTRPWLPLHSTEQGGFHPLVEANNHAPNLVVLRAGFLHVRSSLQKEAAWAT